ncbi:ABC transporter ATP-binding protein/permease [Mumia sp. zg.B21]|uniref:ABC transporter ATP-binding protein n=1 Tax=unclassified Mumia TaxID=2621872 RepID=UPI001C6DDA4D|nr:MULTISPECIES: ABC transporter ATP-binding protein [unclassified Mumia]MBW9209240.1 ABC transporter ATP-binding protein/permease [Mumia sp. zg.B21]MDD9349231.1 ABC transporter ATP-binding protein [Mumia sp.]
MKSLPLDDPGTPDLRSAARYMAWILRVQGWTLVGAVTFGITWMVAQASVPAVIGAAIDAVVEHGFGRGLVLWSALLLLVGAIGAAAGIIRHRLSVQMWLDAAYRNVQLVSGHSGRLGSELNRRVAHGEVVSVGATDLANLGNYVDVAGRFAGAIVAYLVVAVILLRSSTTLGLVVLIGVPVLMLATGPLLRRLNRRNQHARALQGELNTLASDIVAGLRVLRGIGGEAMFDRRYRAASQDVRRAGVQVARVQSVLDALQVLLPGAFVVLVVWLGARYAASGEISTGDLVAFYGYATFLLLPLRTFTEAANKIIRGHVSARHVIRILRIVPSVSDPADPVSPPDGDLVDASTSFVASKGLLTAVVSDDPRDAVALADRLGGYVQPGRDDVDAVTYGDVPLGAVGRDELRRRVVVSDTASALFSGRLRDALDAGRATSDEEVAHALTTASADDVLEALDDGLDGELAERGRSLSGGQRQRIVLARALLTDADVLVLVEPTSAVDSHTEARIAQRLRRHRAGRTTVVVTSSPLVLDVADEVVFLTGGRVVARGEHHHLMSTDRAYRQVVTREEAEDVA